MNESVPCLIWEAEAEELPGGSRDGAYMDSPRAGGPYFVTGSAAGLLRRATQREKARLTSWLVDRRRMGEECPEVTTKIFEDAKRRPPLSVHERADRLLLRFSVLVSDVADDFPGHSFGQKESEIHRRLAWSESVRTEEVDYLETYLESRGVYVELPQYRISVEGYARLAELNQTATDSSRVFVAMWFDDSMDEVWKNAIKPGIEEAGYEPVRIDRKEHVNKIDDEIIAELRRARFVVADFTSGEDGARGGVYYEAGFAHGRDVPVIFSCREDVIEKLHFDTRQYSHIVWEAEKLDEFRDRLKTRIGAVVGDGPLGK